MERSVSLEELLAQRAWVRRLAGALVEAGAVDDVEQELWLRSLRFPLPARGRVRAWLRRVVRSVVADRRRSEARRGKRERMAARAEETASTAGLVAQAELQRAVAAAVCDLKEPYRSAILLRYFEGLSPSVVAKRLGIPVETARTRIKRGLGDLRTRLRRDFGIHDRALGLALVPLLGRRSAGAVTVLGVAAMKLKICLAVTLVLLGLSVGISYLLRAESGGAVARADHVGSPTAPPGQADAEPTADLPGGGTGAEGGEANAATEGRTRVLLTGTIEASSLSVVGPATVRVHQPLGSAVIEGLVAIGEPFEFDVATLVGSPDWTEILLTVDHPACLPAERLLPVHRGQAGEIRIDLVDVKLLTAAAMRGRVVDEAGNAVAGAHVAVFAMRGGSPSRRPVEDVKTGDEGAYLLRVGGDGPYLVVAAAPEMQPAHARADLQVGREVELPSLVLGIGGVTVAGRVTINGVPAPDVKVEVRSLDDGASLAWTGLFWAGGRARRRSATATTGAKGLYAVRGLYAGPHEVRCIDIPGAEHQFTRHAGPRLRVEAPATGVDLDVLMAHIRLAVRDERGPLRARLGLGLKGTGMTDLIEELEKFLLDPGPGPTLSYPTDENGRLTLGVAPETDYEVSVLSRSLRRTLRTPPARETREYVLEVESGPETEDEPAPAADRGSLRVTLKLATGETALLPRHAAFGFWREGSFGERPDFLANAVSEHGVFRLDSLSPGAYRLAVRPGGHWDWGLSYILQEETSVVVRRGGDAAITIAVRTGGRILITARDPSGIPLEATCRVRTAGGFALPVMFIRRTVRLVATSTVQLSDGPTVVHPALPEGTYRIELSCDGYRDAAYAVNVEKGATTPLDATLEPAGPR